MTIIFLLACALFLGFAGGDVLTWELSSVSMPEPFQAVAYGNDDDTGYFLGGYTPDPAYPGALELTQSVYTYSFENQIFSKTPHVNAPSYFATVHQGSASMTEKAQNSSQFNIFIVSPTSQKLSPTSSWIFNPAQNTFDDEVMGNLPDLAQLPCVVGDNSNQLLYIIGGTNATDPESFRMMVAFNTSLYAWFPAQDFALMNTGRYLSSCVLFNNSIYIFGGCDQNTSALSSIERFFFFFFLLFFKQPIQKKKKKKKGSQFWKTHGQRCQQH
ncbi:hypothetical protein RFI_07440 [Reticulomyxa filosa]|uniref:Uncharacterized protein n=1 Tax=Reticulomyxa filosa TaxID=46433 RepID=X6NTR1_RETFI|nr:hypothetical protein RFI_07440 [Reticulomyxa filosa]|eukprot:ETO29680.1 hypothetical protein RFI_07440 [Reticulomyxa filosa]